VLHALADLEADLHGASLGRRGVSHAGSCVERLRDRPTGRGHAANGSKVAPRAAGRTAKIGDVG